MVTQEEMNVLIPEKLKQIELEHNVTVLWAVESGSRAWGYAAPDSDFDVRFLYKRRAEDYLRLNPERDVIEQPIDDTWDLSGWDLAKALKLLRNSNPTLYEWMQSPIVYVSTDFRQRVEEVMNACFSEEKVLYHYLITAKRNRKEFLMGETARPKKYFTVLRPILACMWVQIHHTAPPVPFAKLYDTVLPEQLKNSVDYLLDLKMNAPETMEIPPVADIHDFLETEIQEISQYMTELPKTQECDWELLNRFFIDEINRK